MNKRRSRIRNLTAAGLTAAALAVPAPRAQALFGVGDIVLDPANLAQAVLLVGQSASSLVNEATQIAQAYQQITLQIQSLQDLSFESIPDALNALQVIRGTWASVSTQVEWRRAGIEAWWDVTYDKDKGLACPGGTAGRLR